MTLTITLTEYTNGFALTAFDWREGQLLSEVHEERLEALKALKMLVDNLIKMETRAITGSAL